METVNCIRKLQRAGEGASPVRVNTAEDHSGVSVPKAADIHKPETYRLEYQQQIRTVCDSAVIGSCIGRRCPYNVTGGITNVKKPSSFYKRGDFFVLWDKDEQSVSSRNRQI